MDIGEGLANFGSSIGGALEKRAKMKKEFEQSDRIGKILEDSEDPIMKKMGTSMRSGQTTINDVANVLKFQEIEQQNKLRKAAQGWMGGQGGGLPGAVQGGGLSGAVQGSPQGVTPVLKDITVDGMTFETPKRDIQAEKFDAEQVQKKEEKLASVSMVKDSAQTTLNVISEIEKDIRYFGAMGDVGPLPAEYSKKNWLANFNRLKDKLVVDLMLKLKSASASGSTGFGPLSEKEGLRLENAATALQKGMKEEDAQRNLNEIKDAAKKILGAGSPQKGTVVDGYTFIGGDPGDPKSWSKQ